MADTLAGTKLFFENPKWYLSQRGYYVRIRSDVVRELLNGSRFESILDIGCGDGSISLPVLAPGNRLTLLDLSQNMLDLARSRVPVNMRSQVEALNGDFLNTDLPANAYDLIICLGVLSYVNLPGPFLEKVRLLLKPGGMVLIECTDGDHLLSCFLRTGYAFWNRFRGNKSKMELNAHSAVNIATKFKAMGFETLATYRYSAPLPVFRGLFGPEFQHRKIRAIYGGVANNRMTWLGNECLFQFRKPN